MPPDPKYFYERIGIEVELPPGEYTYRYLYLYGYKRRNDQLGEKRTGEVNLPHWVIIYPFGRAKASAELKAMKCVDVWKIIELT